MIVENIMQKPEMKTLVKIANMSKVIPTSKKMVTVTSLLTKEDKARVKEQVFGSIAVKIGKEAFFLSEIQKVPDTAELQRDNQGLLLGIPMVAGG